MHFLRFLAALVSQPRLVLHLAGLHESRSVLVVVLCGLALASYGRLCMTYTTASAATAALPFGLVALAYVCSPAPPPALTACSQKCLVGKVVIVTGGNGGIGRHVTQGLAARGATVVIACRDAVTGNRTVKEVVSSGGHALYLPLDLSSPASVCQFVAAFAKLFRVCHVLVNNAGVMFPPYQQTDLGWDTQFTVNHLGHLLLTLLLLPELRNAADKCRRPSAVVSVSSVGHVYACAGADMRANSRPPAYEPVLAYANSKLANVQAACWLARTAGPQLTCLSVHPGVVDTGLWGHVSSAAGAALSDSTSATGGAGAGGVGVGAGVGTGAGVRTGAVAGTDGAAIPANVNAAELRHTGMVTTGLRWLHRLLQRVVMKTPAQASWAVVSCVLCCTCGHAAAQVVNGGFHADSQAGVAAACGSSPTHVRAMMDVSWAAIEGWWNGVEASAVAAAPTSTPAAVQASTPASASASSPPTAPAWLALLRPRMAAAAVLVRDPSPCGAPAL